MGILEDIDARFAALERHVHALEKRLAADAREARKARKAPASPPVASLAAYVTHTQKETARILGLGRTKIYLLLESGELTRIKIGRRTLVERASIERLIAKNRDGPKP